MPHITANGIKIYVESNGDPKGTPLLIVRGLGSQIIHWPRAMIDRWVEQGFFVITPDNRDAGLSQKFDDFGPIDETDLACKAEAGLPIDAPYAVSAFADDHAGVLDHFGIDRAHIFGVSMGGMIVQVMAALHPDRVITMTSVMSSSGNPDIPLGSPEVRELLLAQPDDPNDRDSVIAFTLRCDRVWGSPGYPFDDAERADLIGRAFDRCWTPEGVKRHYAAVRSSGSRVELLKTITAPSLVIHGLADTLIQPEHGRDTVRNIPGATLIEITGMGHDLEGALGPLIADYVARHVERNSSA
ncbi:MAG: alpha/beta hydrolase [Rhodospirillales bacterium]|nr:alpha/beta hydrolase [Rhodospirillales bacterium]